MSYSGETGQMSAISVPSRSMDTVRMKSGTVGSFVATGTLTRGQYGLYRWDMPANAGGAGGHFHRGFSEAFYVVEGTPSFFDGRAWTPGAPATTSTSPRAASTGSGTTRMRPRRC